MIPRTTPSCQSDDTDLPKWQAALSGAFRKPSELIEYLNLPKSLLEGANAGSDTFSLRVPLSYCQRIEKGNPNDPLLRQILPLNTELIETPEFSLDPVGDLAAMEAPGLLHKYHGRVLIITTAACAIHCRYCFRRHFPYQENRTEQNWQEAVEYIRRHSDIHEVILSGGDPLSLTESKLKNLTDKLVDIPHIKTLRIHTRQPIVLPERVNNELLYWLDSLPWKIVMVLHCNHANEIDSTVAFALKQLQQRQITLLNQSVLLSGVNDEADTLINLSETLFANHVLPYYLHRLDKVQGAQHFDVGIKKTYQILTEMRKHLPGYLVPRMVEEKAGENSKSAIF